MSKVVLHYFETTGVGEQIRLLLAYGGQEFEDHRIPRDIWPEYKKKTLFGQVPILEIDGKQYAQSMAISRYLGHKYGLVGDTLEDALEIDQNIDYFIDLRLKAFQIYLNPDEAKKEALYAEAYKNEFPEALEKLSSIINKNNGHLALGKLTWGDFVLVGSFEFLKFVLQIPDFEQKYPAFQKVVDNVYSIPQVKAYIASRK